jgi:hypothetical protein
MSIEGFYHRPDAPKECQDCVLDTDCSHQREGRLCKTAQAEREAKCVASEKPSL